MKKFEEYIIDEATANKQITVRLDTGQRELTFELRKMFPPALITAISKALQKKSYVINDKEFKVYI
jgi:hypothetical protein